MRLGLRLTLVILSVVAVMGIASLYSLQINRDIQTSVADLGKATEVEIDSETIVGLTVSISGEWSGTDHFVAEELEELPWSRRPKLRGAIGALDRQHGTISLFGKSIAITKETDWEDLPEGEDPFDLLTVGMRAEVSCRVAEEGAWIARKIKTEGIKSSNKIKGTIDEAKKLASGDLAAWIYGVEIRLDKSVQLSTPRGPLHRMGAATNMTLSIQEGLAAVQELLKEGYRERDARIRDEEQLANRLLVAIEDAEARVQDSFESFGRSLTASRQLAEEIHQSALDRGAADLARAEREKIDQWLDPLAERQIRIEEILTQILEETGRDLDQAQALAQETLAPFVRAEVLPLVHTYHLRTEEELTGKLRDIETRSQTAGRLEVLANIVGLVLALTLGLLVSRSITRRVHTLGQAAREIGHGNLGTRVDVRSGDEIGALGTAFNHMAAELASTTLSLDNLNEILDSMAGALLVLGPDGEVTNANRAALELLHYSNEALIGKSFDEICADAEQVPLAGQDSSEESHAALMIETVFTREDGSKVPISLAGAPLRGQQAGARGFVCLAQDLSEHKQLEEELRGSLHEKELLLRDVHHRVKNNLQVVSSLLDLQSRSITDSESLERFQESQNRIRSMVFIHEQLYRSQEQGNISLRAYLEMIVGHLSQAYLVLPDRIQLHVSVDDTYIDLDRALACGLIVNELVTNAFKHAFSDSESGEVFVTCKRRERGMLRLEVNDSGTGFHDALGREDTDSLGLSLVETLSKQLLAQVTFDGSQGAAFRIDFPAVVPEGAN